MTTTVALSIEVLQTWRQDGALWAEVRLHDGETTLASGTVQLDSSAARQAFAQNLLGRLNGRAPAPDELLQALEQAYADVASGPLPRQAPRERPWPEPPGDSAFSGLAGEVVAAITPHTEADPVALLITFLVAFGIAAGPGPHAFAGATRHWARLFATLVGRTAKARKGDSLAPIQHLLTVADQPDPAAGTVRRRDPVAALLTEEEHTLSPVPKLADRWASGLSSGEGLIWAVRDPIISRVPVKEKGRVVGYDEVETDPGEPDKRLIVVEAEFARVLQVMSRQGNTLSATLRDAWDKDYLRTMTKNSPARATGAHIGLMGHITVEELRRTLLEVEAANGFANRFLWLAVRRSRELPEPEPFRGAAVDALASRIGRALERARGIGLMERDAAARRLWLDVYHALSAEQEGLTGAILARAEAQVLRLSLVYALLDGSATVGVRHLDAALELWAYAERSVRYIFADATGDALADSIAVALAQNGELTRTQIRDLFGRNELASRIDLALQTLLQAGRAAVETRATGGHPVEVWIAS